MVAAYEYPMMNVSPFPIRLEETSHTASAEQQELLKIVSLADITTHPDFQIRRKIDDRLVDKYAKAITNGASFPPIEIALVQDLYILVDGWHRFAAAARARCSAIEAIVTPMTHGKALQAAALANTTHGRPLSQTERRIAFKAFIKGGGHQLPRGRIMSYRDLATTLGGTNGHTTIRQWMEKDFPSIHKRMGGASPHGCCAAKPKAYLPRRSLDELKLDISNIAHLATFETPNTRYEIIQVMEMALTDVKALEHYPFSF